MERPIPTLAFVAPCYNEEQLIPDLIAQLSNLGKELLDAGLISEAPSIVLIDDGSTDKTWHLINAAQDDQCVVGIKLSRNFGHQAALLAGLLETKTDIIVSLDADLQDDISVIPDMIRAYNGGSEIVYGVRSSRKADTKFKRISAGLYYKILEKMGVDIVRQHADFRLMSRKAINALSEFREVNLFLRGLVRSLGFQSETVEFSRKPRMAGETKYPLRKMVFLAIEGITSFSTLPLRYVTWVGFIISILSFFYVGYAVFMWMLGSTVSGWASTVAAIYLLGGIQLMAIGVIGEYIGKIYLETKQRPKYIVDKIISAKSDQ